MATESERLYNILKRHIGRVVTPELVEEVRQDVRGFYAEDYKNWRCGICGEQPCNFHGYYPVPIGEV